MGNVSNGYTSYLLVERYRFMSSLGPPKSSPLYSPAAYLPGPHVFNKHMNVVRFVTTIGFSWERRMNKQARLAYGIRVSNSILRTVNGVCSLVVRGLRTSGNSRRRSAEKTCFHIMNHIALPRRLMRTRQVLFTVCVCMLFWAKFTAAQDPPEDENDVDDTDDTLQELEQPFISASIAFVAACGSIFVVAVVLGLILKFTNPPRLEAFHPSHGALLRQRSRKHGQQVRSSQADMSKSTVNLLHRMPPAAVSSQNLSAGDPFEGGEPVNKVATTSRYMQPGVPQTGARMDLQPVAVGDATGQSRKKHRSRALPQPPITTAYPGSSFQAGGAYYQNVYTGSSNVGMGYSTDYDAPYGYDKQWDTQAGYSNALPYSTYYQSSGQPNEVSPFDAYAVSPAVTQPFGSSSRFSNGYAPLPDVSNNNAMMPEYYYNAGTTTNSTSLRHKNSGASVHRVDSVSAGDHRRHSQRGRNDTKSRTSSHAAPSKRYSNTAYQPPATAAQYASNYQTSYPYTDGFYADGYASHAMPAYGYSGSATYDQNYASYPLREEYRYSTPYTAWDSYKSPS